MKISSLITPHFTECTQLWPQIKSIIMTKREMLRWYLHFHFLSDVECTKPLCPDILIFHSLQKMTHLHSLCVLACKHPHCGPWLYSLCPSWFKVDLVDNCRWADLSEEKDQKVPNIFRVKAAPLLHYTEANTSLKIFFLKRKSQKPWLVEYMVCCSSLYCITPSLQLQMETNLKWPQKSPFAHIYRDAVGGKMFLGHDTRVRWGLHEENKGFFAPL